MKRLVWTICVLVALGLLVTGYVVWYPTWQYEGDGTIRDAGVVSYPRFQVEFEPMKLNEEGSRSFTFRNFPGNPATVLIEIPTTPPPESIQGLSTKIELRVEDHTGGVLCSGSGYPAGRNDEQLFVTGPRGFASGLWLMACNGIDVNDCDPCSLRVSIASIDPQTPAIAVVPTLVGGGIELP